MKLTVAVITFNEEKNIHYPLESAYEMADEVILVDGGSTDDTIKVALSYGKKIKIIKTDNPKNFLENKQKAIKEAKGEWILQLDADEALSDGLRNEIKAMIGEEKTKDGYFTPRKNFFLTRFLMKGGVYPDYVLRLYKKEGAYFELKDVHENVKVKGETGYLRNAILHFADPDFSRYLLRWDRYTSFEASRLAVQGKKPGVIDFMSFIFIKPKLWFLKTYFRHKGFMDGFPGFVFSLFSSIRFWAVYVKWWHLTRSKSPIAP